MSKRSAQADPDAQGESVPRTESDRAEAYLDLWELQVCRSAVEDDLAPRPKLPFWIR